MLLHVPQSCCVTENVNQKLLKKDRKQVGQKLYDRAVLVLSAVITRATVRLSSQWTVPHECAVMTETADRPSPSCSGSRLGRNCPRLDASTAKMSHNSYRNINLAAKSVCKKKKNMAAESKTAEGEENYGKVLETRVSLGGVVECEFRPGLLLLGQHQSP